MAVTKIKPVKSGLRQRLEYIQNPAKTDGKILVSSFGCSFETADAEFRLTLSKAREKGNNLAHHLIQSFEPGESTPEQAHEIGKTLLFGFLLGCIFASFVIVVIELFVDVRDGYFLC